MSIVEDRSGTVEQNNPAELLIGRPCRADGAPVKTMIGKPCIPSLGRWSVLLIQGPRRPRLAMRKTTLLTAG